MRADGDREALSAASGWPRRWPGCSYCMREIRVAADAAKACLDANDPVRALEFALTAVRAELLRESSWRLVITAHGIRATSPTYVARTPSTAI
jgi:hypothetical protein